MTRQITVATSVLVLAVVAGAVLVVVRQSRPSELLEPVRPGAGRIYVDSVELIVALMLLGAGAIVVAGVLSWLIARRAVRPLGDALRIQRTFVADASHELRTPLAALDARVQLLQLRTDPTTDVGRSVAELRTDSRTLVDLVNDLLLAAGEDTAEGSAAPTDAVATVTAAVESMRALAAPRGISILVEHDDAAAVAMPATSLRRCVTALVDNAVNHSNDGAQVVVSLTSRGSVVDLVVIDHGSGISGIDPSRVFDRFAHAEPPSRPGTTGRRPGFGIGLALIRDLAVRNGGTVAVASTSAAGTTIVLTVPSA
ncbi:HAMP domain-containing histidine kinase [Xylanimonas allomyrinae]|uniref:histidine kinase n=1 Tax=Xylanimonas allomyrinae TaxID=2509459 RepID=A0A4P6ES46_9MICO|nr:HAMP domain-containing sensor histidine kinase [Xylanimonas allomyrinae]QAY63217.1 HAMP domain-containing histidine kinase [Xylanimonas allomyrinae]